MTGFVATVVEAWDELKVHRLRVLLALIGVAVAVAAITTINAAITMMQQAYTEQNETWNGRDTTITASAYPTSMWETGIDDGSLAETVVDAEYRRIVERYQVAYAGRTSWVQLTARLPDGPAPVDAQALDPDVGVIRRVRVTEGRWLTDADSERLAPVVVVNETMLTQLGHTDLSGHPTVELVGGEQTVTGTVVGVMPSADYEMPMMYLPIEQARRWGLIDTSYGPPSLLLWVPPELAQELTDLVRRDLAAALPDAHVDAYNNADVSTEMFDRASTYMVYGVSGFALLLGGLGLLNIALVTVRYRIREIGIRRSFGATSWRIFVGVAAESVVATAVAGAIGVAIAVGLLTALPVESVFGMVQDKPPFPLSAAVIGMAAAVAVGALAGTIPALTAVRVKVIDAIRY